jgi:hypothetical protein
MGHVVVPLVDRNANMTIVSAAPVFVSVCTPGLPLQVPLNRAVNARIRPDPTMGCWVSAVQICPPVLESESMAFASRTALIR